MIVERATDEQAEEQDLEDVMEVDETNKEHHSPPSEQQQMFVDTTIEEAVHDTTQSTEQVRYPEDGDTTGCRSVVVSDRACECEECLRIDQSTSRNHSHRVPHGRR